jgi:hypothetical protein
MPTERQAIRKWMQENPERAATLKDLFDKGLLHGMEEAIAVDEPLTMICGPESGGILGSRGLNASAEPPFGCHHPAERY